MWDRNAASASPSEVLAAHEPVASHKHDAAEVPDVCPNLLAPEGLRHLSASDLEPQQEAALEHLPQRPRDLHEVVPHLVGVRGVHEPVPEPEPAVLLLPEHVLDVPASAPPAEYLVSAVLAVHRKVRGEHADVRPPLLSLLPHHGTEKRLPYPLPSICHDILPQTVSRSK